MAARGMPFYADQLMSEIKEMVDSSTQLSNTEKRILQFELKRRDADVFSDKTSIYEYRDLLSIMSSGHIDTKNYQGFRLFSIDGKVDYQNESNQRIDKEIKENNQLFEKIDRGLRFGNLESEMSMIFEDNIIAEIQKAHKKHSENWSALFSYAQLLAAKEKKQEKMENPLKIENDDISIYGDLPLNVFSTDENVIMRNEGSQTAKKRTKNILIFNAEKYSTVHIQVSCNAKVTNNGILKDDAEYEKRGKNIIFEFLREGISFHRVQVKDETNNITYIFKVCIIDISAEYMYATVKHSFTIDYKNNKKNCRLKLAGIGTDLTFNRNASENNSCKLEDNEIYVCKYGERLNIYTSEEELSNYGSGIKIEINFSGIVVPFSLFPDEPRSQEIVGRRILKEKYAKKKSFEFEEDRILGESQEYFAKTNLLRELKIEKAIIDENIITGRIKNNATSASVSIEKIDCKLLSDLKSAYLEMLKAFKDKKTVPTLAYLGKDLRKYIEKYIDEFKKCFANLSNDEYLSAEQENALLLGTISVGKDNDEILFTPFHPLNMAYQLTLLDETGIENVTDVVLDRLNSVNLLPYIQRNKKIYKVSDQLYSLEWKYYAPADNKKYRGSRRYVQKLVEEKISEYVSHFRYIFDEINNRTLRINLIKYGGLQ